MLEQPPYPPPDRQTYCCQAGWHWNGTAYECDHCHGDPAKQPEFGIWQPIRDAWERKHNEEMGGDPVQDAPTTRQDEAEMASPGEER